MSLSKLGEGVDTPVEPKKMTERQKMLVCLVWLAVAAYLFRYWTDTKVEVLLLCILGEITWQRVSKRLG